MMKKLIVSLLTVLMLTLGFSANAALADGEETAPSNDVETQNVPVTLFN
ncbi:hypothetical protein IMZ31_18795 (plasmid) [Pontibacillus sp. ALD_SL1]|nr:hypothetical protein [Pontibacillus sp. ALD_SL1]QST02597.1 hypothetical protein IMZ31_18795 [Pontibacillus sp. ALD_SL1]